MKLVNNPTLVYSSSMNIKTISGGYQVPDDECLGKFQIESDRLDHDRHLVPIACEHIKPGMVVLDGGAFNSDHTIAYRRAATVTGEVFSVEANPFTFGMLKHNLRLQEVNEGTLVGIGHALNVALSHDVGYILARIEEKPNLGSSHLERQMIVDKDSKTVPMVSIDFLSRIYAVKFGFIKLDIEGYEYDALMGASACLTHDKPTMMIEMCAETLKRQNANYAQIYRRLEAYEYKWEILQPQCTVDSPQYDILATPK